MRIRIIFYVTGQKIRYNKSLAKCPFSGRGMLISEVWDKVEYLEMHEGKLKLKRGHRYYTQITGEMAMSGLERLFFVV